MEGHFFQTLSSSYYVSMVVEFPNNRSYFDNRYRSGICLNIYSWSVICWRGILLIFWSRICRRTILLEQIVLKSNLPEGETSPAESAGAEFAGSECTTSKLCQAKTHFFKRKKGVKGYWLDQDSDSQPKSHKLMMLSINPWLLLRRQCRFLTINHMFHINWSWSIFFYIINFWVLRFITRIFDLFECTKKPITYQNSEKKISLAGPRTHKMT